MHKTSSEGEQFYRTLKTESEPRSALAIGHPNPANFPAPPRLACNKWSLPPFHRNTAQDRLLACLLQFKKNCEINSSLRIAQITATGLGRLLSSPCPGVLGEVGGWVAMVWWITQEKEKSLRNWHLGVHRTPRRREPLLCCCPGSILRPIPHSLNFTFPISLWDYSFFLNYDLKN